MLPDGWKEARFGNVAVIASGQVDPRAEPYSNWIHVGPENIPVGGGYLIGELQTASKLRLISGKYAFDRNTILYSKIRPNLNKVALARFDGLCSADMYPIWPKGDHVDKEYVYQFMRSPIFVVQATKTSMRTGLPKINRPDLLAIKVILPPLSEQHRVAEILRTWDEAIERTEKLIAAKQAAKSPLMERLLRPCCDDGGSDWPEVHLGDVFDERVERGADGEQLLAITASRGVVDRDVLERRDTSSEDKSNYKLIQPGDIGYNTMRMWQGVNGLSKLRGIVSPVYTICIPRNDKIDGKFAAYLFKLPRMIFQFFRFSQGLVNDTLSLKFPNFAKIRLCLPDLNKQREIAAVLKAQDDEIDILAAQKDQFQEQKRGLMQKLLTGKWRVPITDASVDQVIEEAMEARP